MNPSVFALIPLLAAIASLGLGVFVFRERGSHRVGKVFAVLATMLVAWNLHFVALYAVTDEQLALTFAGYFRWGSILLAPLVLHISLALRPKLSRPWRYILLADYGLAFLLVIGDLLGQVVVGLKTYPWGYYSIGGPLYGLFSFSIFTNFALATIAVVTQHQNSEDPVERLQLKFWLLGISLALPLGLTNLFPAYGISIYPLGNLGNVAWAGVIAYAIARYRLMAIDVIATKSAAYVLVAIGLLIPLVAATTILQQRSFGSTSIEFSLGVCGMLLAAAFIFPNLRARAEMKLASSFLTDTLANRASIQALTHTIIRTFDREKLIRQVVDGLFDSLALETVSLGLVRLEQRHVDLVYTSGPSPTETTIHLGNPLIDHLATTLASITRAEAGVMVPTINQSAILPVLQAFRWEVCLPLAASGTLIGILAVGRRSNLGAFSADDLRLLDTLAAETGIALDNARLNDELRRSQSLIQRADRSSALGVLAAGIAHEVRNPLVSIRTFFQLAPERLDDEEFMTSFLATASSEVERISRLINELLSFARSPTPSFDDVDLNAIIESTAVLVGPEAKKLKIRLIVTPSDASIQVRANFEQLRQAVLNLVLNALQATSEGGNVTLTACRVTDDGISFGRVIVEDAGSGIPAACIANVFDPFYTTKASGTGLGLAIVEQIAQEHSGRVSVESASGNGTVFRFDIPIVITRSLI